MKKQYLREGDRYKGKQRIFNIQRIGILKEENQINGGQKLIK